MSRMQLAWDEELRGLRFQIPSGWESEIYTLFTGRIVKSVRIVDLNAAGRTIAVWDSCSGDPNPAPVSGAYTTIPPALDPPCRQIAVLPYHAGTSTCLDAHAGASTPFEPTSEIIRSVEEDAAFERAVLRFDVGGVDSVETVVVIKRMADAAAGERALPIREYIDAVVWRILARSEPKFSTLALRIA
jgi:hypothetical protein